MAKAAQGLASRFTLASDRVKHRTIASIEGEVGTGKTYFTLTAPGPVLIQNIDKGTEGVVEQFRQQGKEIYEEKYLWEPGDVDEAEGNVKAEEQLKEEAIEVRNKWERDAFYAMDNGVRTLTMDNESRIWQVYRYAEFGGPNSGDMKDYDKLNQRFEALINRAKERDVNLFLIRAMKDRWGMFGSVNPKTGKKSFAKSGREVWGYEHLPGVVFTELTFLYNPDTKEYSIKVGKCRHNENLQFDTVPRCSFPELGTLMIEGSNEEDWA